MDEQKTIYYEDELNDELVGSKIEAVKIDGNYRYIYKNPIWNITAFVLYRIIAMPLAWIYAKIKFKMKIENRETIKKCKGQGFFLYSNHTQELLDVITPTLVSFPKRTYVIASPVNISLKGTSTAVRMLGALPTPDDIDSGKNFLEAIKKYIDKKKVIAIYPEAHVWPYYTKIRPYTDISFKYPAKLNTPVYSATTTYQKRKNGKPKITVYIDGPFYPNDGLSMKERTQELRNRVYNTMIERSKNSSVEFIKYVKKYNKFKKEGNRYD